MIRKESSRGGRERREKERWEMAKEERRKQEGGGEEEDHEHSSGEIDRIKQWYLPSLIISCISLCLLGEQDEQQRSIERAESEFTSLIQRSSKMRTLALSTSPIAVSTLFRTHIYCSFPTSTSIFHHPIDTTSSRLQMI